MRLANVVLPDTHRPTLVLDRGDRLVEAAAAARRLGLDAPAGGPVGSTDDWLRGGPEVDAWLREVDRQVPHDWPLDPSAGVVEPDHVRYAPAVLAPGKAIAVAKNYADHRRELGDAPDRPAVPGSFLLAASALNAHRAPIVVPDGLQDVDHEVELVAVIGQRSDGVAVEEALGLVAAYTVGNDVSARRQQWAERDSGGGPMVGKNGRGFAPFGPVLVSADEVSDPQTLHLRCSVDGVVHQDASSAAMLFSVAELIAWYARIGLDPGDVIFTGTPSGVGAATGRWLRPGQEVTCTIDGIATLVNRLEAPTQPSS